LGVAEAAVSDRDSESTFSEDGLPYLERMKEKIMSDHIFNKLKTIRLWHLVWISLILSEAFTAIMNTIMGLIWRGRIDIDLLLIGTVDAFIVGLLVSTIVIIIFRQIRNYERRAEATLKALNARLEGHTMELSKLLKAISVATEGIAITDENDRFIYINDAYAMIYGYLRGELIGKTWRDTVSPDLELAIEEDTEKTLRNRAVGVWSGEVPAIRKDGTVVPTEVTATSRWDESGNYLGHICVVRNITERKRAEEVLQLTRFTVDNVADAVYWMDSKAQIVDVNETACNMLGYTREYLLNLTVFDIDPDFTADKWKNAWNALKSQGRITLETVHRTKDGRMIPVEIMANYLSFGGKELDCAFARDITERKRAEMELEKYRDHLEELIAQRTKELSLLNDQLRQSQKLEAVGILAGGIAHEFNNILATMKGSIYLIQKKMPEGSPTMKYAEQILASMKKANTLSQGLLTFSRKQMISLRPLHLNEIICNVGKMLIQLIGEDIELAMMPSDKDPMVMADMNQIEQVLLNLATNARDAMPDGGRLTIGTDVMNMDEDFKKRHGYGIPGEYAVLTVSDSGTGMDETIRGKIFEPFFTTKVVGKGSGLGLAVTYGIVKQHNGFIDVESVPAEGTTFRIYFPTVEERVIQPIARERSLAMGGAETVLLAEDDVDARTIMREMLKMNGYTVLEAGDGEEAVRVYMENKDRVQLVFIDVRMPKKNGREVHEEIKKVHPQAKFLFISGYTADIMKPLGVNEGGINFISKAALPDEILMKIREVLDQ
jgi:two-component system cell cycle sensor histidine kinase/response regulator CckA